MLVIYFLKSFSSCGSGIESTSDSFLHCPVFDDNRNTLLSTLNNTICKILNSTDSFLAQTFLFGSTSFDTETDMLKTKTLPTLIIYISIFCFGVILMKMMKMMINCFCGMLDRRKAFSLISNWDHCQRSLPLRITNMPRAGF